MEILIDYETRSHIDLKKAGHWRYAADPTTEIICVGATVREHASGQWAVPAIAVLIDGQDGREAVEKLVKEAGEHIISKNDFIYAMQNSKRFVAHNVGFERSNTICQFPELNIPLDRWSCTMARACRIGLPAALEGLMKAIGGPEKDMEGNRIGLQCAKPRPTWKKKGQGREYFDDAERLARVATYCARDIKAEIFADNYLPELDELEKSHWLMVMEENTRGMFIDLEYLEKSWAIAELGKKEATDYVSDITQGQVTNLNSTADIHAFIKQYGIFLDNLRAADLERYLTEDETIPATARDVLSNRLDAAKSSIKKLAAIKYRLMGDGRVRDLQVYHGAHTGRTTGQGPQPLNLPRPGDVDVEAAHEAIAAMDIPKLRTCVAKHARNRAIGVTAGVKQAKGPKQALGLPEAASGALRGVFAASPGKRLIVADFSGIETAALMTICGQEDRLQQIRNKERLYSIFASQIYGYPVNKKDNPTEDLLGKQGVLSLGYGSGPDKFAIMCAQYQIMIDAQLSEHVVKTYRNEFAPRVPKGWWSLNEAALSAIKSSGLYFEALGHVYYAKGDWLFCQLPSGRWLHYPGVELFRNRFGRDEISCLHWEKKQLVRKKLYGGLFMENNIQSFCRDLMVEREAVVTAHPLIDVLFTTYDEIIAECDEKYACECLDFLVKTMTGPPAWLPNMPVTAEGWKEPGLYYKKD